MSQLPYNSSGTSFLKEVKHNSGLQLLLFMILWLFSNMLASVLSTSIASVAGINDLNLLLEGFKSGQYLEHINTIKVISIVAHLCQYLLPVVLYLLLVHNEAKLQTIYVDKAPSPIKLMLAILLIVSIYPFISFIYYWNTQLIPQDAIAQDTLDLQSLMLKMNHVSDLILNLVLFGFVAGFGEELFYRGILQKLFTKRSKNIHFGALLTAITFSLMHFQPEGFMPRFILGLLFSYMLIISSNLWITIVVHMLFNSTQVLIPYFYPQLASNVNHIESISLGIAFVSLFLFLGIFYTFKQAYKLGSDHYFTNLQE